MVGTCLRCGMENDVSCLLAKMVEGSRFACCGEKDIFLKKMDPFMW